MIHRLDFAIEGEPIAKGRPRAAVQGGRAHVYTPKETVAYERMIKQVGHTMRERYAASTGDLWPMHAASYYLFTDIYISARTPDGDNVYKSVADGLIGALYADDKKVGGFFPPSQVDARPRVEIVLVAFDLRPSDSQAKAVVDYEIVSMLAQRIARARSSGSRDLAIVELVDFIRNSKEPRA